MHHVTPREQCRLFQRALGRVGAAGIFVYKDMCQRPYWKSAINRLHDLVLSGQWIHYVALENVVTWAIEKGFNHLHTERYSTWGYGHELAVFKRM
jgi:hypothetical protein